MEVPFPAFLKVGFCDVNVNAAFSKSWYNKNTAFGKNDAYITGGSNFVIWLGKMLLFKGSSYIIMIDKKEHRTMNKRDLVAAMAEKSGLSRKNCEAALDAFVAATGDALQTGDKVHLVGFGTFEVKERAARTGRNPKTKEPVDIPASKQPVFRPGKALKGAVI